MTDKALRINREIFDWDDANELYVFCLPSAGRDALLEMSHRLFWSIWVTDGENPTTLVDSELGLIQDTVRELMGGIKVSDLLAEIERIVDSVHCSPSTGTSGGNSMCCCCGCGESSTGEPFDPTVVTDPPPIPSEYPPTVTDQWKCEAAGEIVDNWALYWQNVAESVDGGILLEAALATGTIFVNPFTAVIALLAVALGGVARYVADKTSDWFELNKAELVCVLYRTNTPAGAKLAALSYIDQYGGSPPGGPVGGIIKFATKQTMEMSNWNMYFQEDSFAISPANQGANCAGCNAPIPLPDPIPPMPDPLVIEGILWGARNEYSVNLTQGGYEIKEDLQVYYYVPYHLRSRPYSATTSSGHEIGIELKFDEAGGYGDEVFDENMIVINQAINHSGNTNGDDVFHIWGANGSGIDLWRGLADIPIEVVGFKRFRATDTDNEWDVVFWFEPS